jgi:intracellular sulfur oxidation DsrE/DsrF family protein
MGFARKPWVVTAATLAAATSLLAQSNAPKAPVIPEADGYVTIPNAAVPPDASRIYKAVFDARSGASAPSELLPAINMAGSELNALAVAGVPGKNAKFVLVFHGDATDGILDEAHYKAKFGVSNPNLKALAAMKSKGVELFVCGLNLVFEHIDPKTLSQDVTVASDALIVLMTYQTKVTRC